MFIFTKSPVFGTRRKNNLDNNAPISAKKIRIRDNPFAFAACVGAGLGRTVRLDTVQAEGCAPLADTWVRIAAIDHPERYWAHVMRPWPDPHSLARQGSGHTSRRRFSPQPCRPIRRARSCPPSR